MADGDNVVLCNAAMHTMIKSVSFHFNSQQVKQNPLYGFTSYMRFVIGMAPLARTLGRRIFYNFVEYSSIPSAYTADYFQNASKAENKI